MTSTVVVLSGQQDPISFGKSSGISSSFFSSFSMCNDELKDDDATANYRGKSDTLRIFVCLMEENIVPFYYIIVERKMRFQTRSHIEKISKLNLASNVHHSYIIQHRSHGCARNFPILTLANTSLKRMKFVYTQKQKGILIRAIFGCEKFHAIIIVSLIFGNMFPNQQTIWSNIARTYHWKVLDWGCVSTSIFIGFPSVALPFIYVEVEVNSSCCVCLLSRNQCQNDESLSTATGKILVTPAILCVCVSCIIEFSAFARVPLL